MNQPGAAFYPRYYGGTGVRPALGSVSPGPYIGGAVGAALVGALVGYLAKKDVTAYALYAGGGVLALNMILYSVRGGT
jgi:hypothetical protein